MTANNDIAHPLSTLGMETAAPSVNPATSGVAEKSRASGKRIALFGLFGCGNLGNDGSLEAMLTFVRHTRPEADIVSICDNPALVSQSFEVSTLPISWSRHLTGLPRKIDRLLLKIPGKLVDLMQSFRYLRKVDTIIIPGTGILDDFGERPYGMPFDIFRWCLAAKLMRTRTAFVSIGAGPIRHPASRWLMVTAARLADYRSYRDTVSKTFMDDAGFDTSADNIYPDIAFSLPLPTTRARPEPKAGKLRIGVGVMSYYGWYGFAHGGQAIYDTYIAKLSRFVSHLLDKGHDVRLLTGEMTDMAAVKDVLATVADSNPDLAPSRIIAEPSHSLRELMGQMMETDMVVATRFHNIVCALKIGKPTISLGYAKKNDVLMKEMGLAEFCQHVETFDPDTLIGQFDRLLAARQQHEAIIAETNARFRQRLQQQEALLTQLFL